MVVFVLSEKDIAAYQILKKANLETNQSVIQEVFYSYAFSI